MRIQAWGLTITVAMLLFALSAREQTASATSTITLRPNANGYLTQWETEWPEGQAHYTLVDDVTPDDDATRIKSGIWGYIDAFQLSDTGLSGVTIEEIIIHWRWRDLRADYWAGVILLVRVYGQNYELGTYQTYGDAYANSSVSLTTNPITGSPWSIPELDDLQVGFKVASIGGTQPMLTQVYVVVVYTATPPSGTILRPNANGYLNEWETEWPQGQAHYTLVDDVTPDDDATRIKSGIWGRIDAFQLSDIGASGVTIENITIHWRWRDLRAGYTAGVIPFVRLYGQNASLGTYQTYGDMYANSSATLWTNPFTAQPWTVSELDNLEIGFEVAPIGGTQPTITQVYVEVASHLVGESSVVVVTVYPVGGGRWYDVTHDWCDPGYDPNVDCYGWDESDWLDMEENTVFIGQMYHQNAWDYPQDTEWGLFYLTRPDGSYSDYYDALWCHDIDGYSSVYFGNTSTWDLGPAQALTVNQGVFPDGCGGQWLGHYDMTIFYLVAPDLRTTDHSPTTVYGDEGYTASFNITAYNGGTMDAGLNTLGIAINGQIRPYPQGICNVNYVKANQYASCQTLNINLDFAGGYVTAHADIFASVHEYEEGNNSYWEGGYLRVRPKSPTNVRVAPPYAAYAWTDQSNIETSWYVTLEEAPSSCSGWYTKSGWPKQYSASSLGTSPGSGKDVILAPVFTPIHGKCYRVKVRADAPYANGYTVTSAPFYYP